MSVTAIDTINFVVALSGVTIFLLGTVLIVDRVTSQSFRSLVRTFGLWIALFVTVTGSAIALTYSDILGFIPCGLCWFQRVFLFSQPFLIVTALVRKDENMMPYYGVVLSAAGLIIALYQHYLQMGGIEVVGCPAAGAGADCAERVLFEFGFVTYPLLAAMLFFFLGSLYHYLIRLQKN